MPFKHIIDNQKNIVVLKAKGRVSVVDIIAEIQEAINTRRGKGISRRLVDMTEQDLLFSREDGEKIVKMIKASADILGARKMAILLKEIPDEVELIRPLLKNPGLAIEFFTDKADAARFLSTPAKTKKKKKPKKRKPGA